jgi:hypothetical protein
VTERQGDTETQRQGGREAERQRDRKTKVIATMKARETIENKRVKIYNFVLLNISQMFLLKLE